MVVSGFPLGAPLIDDDNPDFVPGNLTVLGPGRIRCSSLDGLAWSEWALCESDRCSPHGLPIVELVATSGEAPVGQVRHWVEGFDECAR